MKSVIHLRRDSPYSGVEVGAYGNLQGAQAGRGAAGGGAEVPVHLGCVGAGYYSGRVSNLGYGEIFPRLLSKLPLPEVGTREILSVCTRLSAVSKYFRWVMD